MKGPSRIATPPVNNILTGWLAHGDRLVALTPITPRNGSEYTPGYWCTLAVSAHGRLFFLRNRFMGEWSVEECTVVQEEGP